VNERGRDHLLRALALDPDYGLAHAYLGLAEVMIANYGLAPRPVLEAAKAEALTGVGLAPEESRCHRILGYVRSLLGEFAAAEDAVRRAHELNPFDAEAMMHLSSVLEMRGRCVEALDWIDRAIALNPLHPPYYHHVRSYPLYQLGRYEECAAELALVPRLAARAEVRMAAALAMAGREAEAVARLDRAAALEPDLRPVEAARASYRCERADDLEHILTGIRAALDARARLRG
jgi:tetratricopeptide (TPR) repeat protein